MTEKIEHNAHIPPFGTPPTMTVRLVADIQNRLLWRVGTGRASECCVPSADGARHPEMGSDVPAEQRPCRALIRCVAAAAQVYVRENFLGDVHLLRYGRLLGTLIGEA